jgi:leader peptidase (prepilin peptidase) / N-methyltransferase
MLIVLLFLIFLLGSLVGCLLNLCISRLPLEKSILWPASRCSHCLQDVALTDLVPLASYWLRGGRCRICQARLSPRHFVIEVLTGLAFVLLFLDVAVFDFQHLGLVQAPKLGVIWMPTFPAWIAWLQRIALFCLLFVTTMCDLDHFEIPLGITIPGTLIGLLFAAFFAWPWPHGDLDAYADMPPNLTSWSDPNLKLTLGLYPWPFWGPLPAWFLPGGNFQTGLATGLIGAFVGTAMVRVIRFVFSWGFGKEAMGLGDADLMMMAGAFLGWQAVVVAFILGIFIGLSIGIGQLVLGRGNMMPFGPPLAAGALVSCLAWPWLGPAFQPILFSGFMLTFLVSFFTIGMFIACVIIRVFRLVTAKA